jgi:hypothetical protein
MRRAADAGLTCRHSHRTQPPLMWRLFLSSPRLTRLVSCTPLLSSLSEQQVEVNSVEQSKLRAETSLMASVRLLHLVLHRPDPRRAISPLNTSSHLVSSRLTSPLLASSRLT